MSVRKITIRPPGGPSCQDIVYEAKESLLVSYKGTKEVKNTYKKVLMWVYTGNIGRKREVCAIKKKNGPRTNRKERKLAFAYIKHTRRHS